MNIKCNYHNSPKILAKYMHSMGDNDNVTPLFTRNTIAKDGENAVLEMGIDKTAKSKHFAYHYQISPHPKDKVSAEDITYMIDTVLRHRGLADRKQAWAMHFKNGRMHIHGAISAYNPKTGKMDPNKKWARDNDKARKEIEETKGLVRTRERNPDHKIVAEFATAAWNNSTNHYEFENALNKFGCALSFGGKASFYVVYNGTAFPLAGKVKGVGPAALYKRLDKRKLSKTEDVIRYQRREMDRHIEKALQDQFKKYSKDERREEKKPEKEPEIKKGRGR